MHSFPPRLPGSRFIGRQMREESDDFDTGFTVDTCWDQMKGNFTPPSRVEVVWSSRHEEDSFRGRHLQFRHAVSNEPRVTQDVLTKTASPIDLHRFHTWRAPKEVIRLCVVAALEIGSALPPKKPLWMPFLSAAQQAATRPTFYSSQIYAGLRPKHPQRSKQIISMFPSQTRLGDYACIREVYKDGLAFHSIKSRGWNLILQK